MKILLTLLALALPAAAIEPGFTPLYNGKDLTGWKKVNGNGEYKAAGPELLGIGENVKSNTFLRTEKTYKNFDLRFDMKFDDTEGNSGIMIRGLQKTDKEDGRVYGYQCEHDPSKRCWTAGLYCEGMPRGWLVPNKADKAESDAFTAANTKRYKVGEWNSIRVLCEGNHIQIWLNGEQTVNYTDTAPEAISEGFFGLQVHAGKTTHVRWRDIRIKELP
ncbi:MAG: DUF1080 domain-containing protein [Luteolibacter sp.]